MGNSGGPAWQQMLEQLPVGVALYRAGRYAFVNEALTRMVRIEAPALMQLDPFSLLSPEEGQRIRDRYVARARGEAITPAYEMTVRRGDGTWVQLEVEPRMVGPDEVLMVFRDLSSHRREQLLLGELGVLAARVQRTSDSAGMLEAAIDGLFRLGFHVALARVVEGACRFESVRARPELEAFLKPVLGRSLPLKHVPGAEEAFDRQRGAYFDDGPAALRLHLEAAGVAIPADLLVRLREAGMDKAAVSPLCLHGQPWGLLVVVADALSPQSAAALSLFCAQLAAALERAQTIDELTQQNRRLEAINAMVQAASDPDLSGRRTRILRIVMEATGSDAACFYRAVPAEGVLVMEEQIGAPGWFTERYRRLPLAGSVTGGAASGMRGRALMLDDWPPEHREHVARVGFLSSALLPLVADDKVSGSLNLSRRRAEPYTDQELRAAEMLASQLAVLMERSRLLVELRRSYDELALAQKELVKRERLAALGELAAVIAHEVRNPLGVVFNSLATLTRLGPSPDAAQLITIIGEESERLDRLVADLLDFARPHEPRLKPEVLADVVVSAVEAAERGTGLHGVTIRVEVPRTLPSVLLDAQLCRQAILNLLLNGAQAMGRGGEVVVRGSVDAAKPGCVRLDVRDSGVGVPAELGDRIYQPFFTTRASGTGLGLALVKRIAEAHQAELSFVSPPGEGTTFTLWLPKAG